VQSGWWAWAPQTVLPGGSLGAQEVCAGRAHIDTFVVGLGSAVVNANTTRAFRMTGILSVQARCSDGAQLGYYGPAPSDSSVMFTQQGVQVRLLRCFCACSAPGDTLRCRET
jgi:hypothetical protein